MLTVGIVGAGPAGLSAARLLQETGRARAIVFERQERVGGKSLSTPRFGAVHEMGTCYSTLAHVHTNRWMRQLGVRQRAIGRQLIDGRPLRAFISGGDTLATIKEAQRFVFAWRDSMRAFEFHADDPAVIAEAASSVEEWLERRRFVALRRFMLRGLTNMGYGYLDRTPTVQALRWCSPSLLASGSLNQVKAPQGGWQSFWESLSRSLDVRVGQPVTEIRRRVDGVDIVTPTGATLVDVLLVAAPLDELGASVKLTDAEQGIVDAVTWDSYVVSLCAVTGWYRGGEVLAFEKALQPGAPAGALLSVRPAGPAPKQRDGVRHFMTGQYGSGLSPAELAARLASDLQHAGGYLDHVAIQKVWKYNPVYRADSIRAGLLTAMKAMQGKDRTWYTGSAFAFESVSNIVSFNSLLVPRIVSSS